MATTQAMIGSWFDQGVNQGATHMIVVVDTFDHDDYPVFVTVDKTLPDTYEVVQNTTPIVARSSRDVVALFDGPNMQKVMEVYDLSMNKDTQLSEFRAFHY